MSETKVSLKLLVDCKANKVLFAEAGIDFVDFLFSLLSLPISNVVNLLNNHNMVGSLGGLHKSIDYFQPNLDENTVLQPTLAAPASVPLLKINKILPRKKVYRRCSHKKYVNEDPNTICPDCGKKVSRKNVYVASKKDVNVAKVSSSVGRHVTYMIMDDLEVKPMSTISGITLINNLQVTDLSSLVEKQVEVGLAEGLALLKAAFEAGNTVLSTVFLSK